MENNMRQRFSFNFSANNILSAILLASSVTLITSCGHTRTSDDIIEKTIETVSIKKLESLIPYQKGKLITTGSSVKGSTNGAINLEQGWTEASQQEYYYTSQGSQLLPYSWFLSLEQATNNNKFNANENMQRFGYISSTPSEANPDGLSVGFAKATNPLVSTPDYNKEWVGLTCAACHTTEVNYNNKIMRIDGGPTMADFQTFNFDLIKALQATLDNESKFQRFSKAIFKSYPSISDATLRQDLQIQTQLLTSRNAINHFEKNQAPYGHARVDAIGEIFNQIMTTFNRSPTNARASNAPVSYPFLWGTHQSDVVQWTGFAPNGPFSLGALIRNGGEVLGVYGDIDIRSEKTKTAYPSTLMFRNLGNLEARVAQLRSPAWPKGMLPDIDSTLKNNGAKLYQEHCSGCHQVIAREDEGQPYNAVLTDLSELKTDSTEILNLVTLRDANLFYGRKEFGVAGPEIPYATSGLNPLVNSVIGAIFDQPAPAIEAAFVQYFGGKLAEMPGNGIDISPAQKEINSGKVEGLYKDLKKAYKTIKGAYNDCHKSNTREEVCKFLAEALQYGAKLKKEKSDKGKSAETLAGMVYKGRPLNGIWATAPYLHNGSVPNLEQLLLPPESRLTHFYLGSREFDPKVVGYVHTKSASNTSYFDTTLLGNSNGGHVYGTELTKPDRQALIEYMKSL